MEPLTEEWTAAVIAAAEAADSPIRGDISGTVAFAIGKKRQASVALSEGRLGPADDGEVDLTLPFASDEELAAYLSGEQSVVKAYIRGDFKPVGSTGVLIPMIELIESGALASVASA